MMITRQADFTTTAPEQDLLQLEVVKARIKEMKNIVSDADYASLFAVGINGERIGIYARIQVLADNNKISINGRIYDDMILLPAYDTNFFEKIWAIKIKNAGSGTIVITLK